MERIRKGLFDEISKTPEFDSVKLKRLIGFDPVEVYKDKWVMSDFEKALTQRQNRIAEIARSKKEKPREIPQLERFILLAEVKKMRDTYRKRVEEIGNKYGDSFCDINRLEDTSKYKSKVEKKKA